MEMVLEEYSGTGFGAAAADDTAAARTEGEACCGCTHREVTDAEAGLHEQVHLVVVPAGQGLESIQ